MTMLTDQYSDNIGMLERFSKSLISEISTLLNENSITLGVPIESRVKTIESLIEKSERKSKNISTIFEIDDLIGIRLILLFHSDVENVESILLKNFNIIEREDAADRLDEDQFGYQSKHFLVKMPDSWLKIPSLAGFGNIKAEIQVRTLSQHIWAAVSHKLQYKSENSVPPDLRRAINRASALLEMVDLEFDRVMNQRREYQQKIASEEEANAGLNVDILIKILDETLPIENKKGTERYSELLIDLQNLGVDNSEKLKNIIAENISYALQEDKRRVKSGELIEDDDLERIAKGVFYTHTGLLRIMLRKIHGANRLREISKLRL